MFLPLHLHQTRPSSNLRSTLSIGQIAIPPINELSIDSLEPLPILRGNTASPTTQCTFNMLPRNLRVLALIAVLLLAIQFVVLVSTTWTLELFLFAAQALQGSYFLRDERTLSELG